MDQVQRDTIAFVVGVLVCIGLGATVLKAWGVF